jgi:hypothetical protein
MFETDPTLLHEIFLWIVSRLPSSQQQRITSLQGALEPRILLSVLSDVLPVLKGEPGLSEAIGDDEALITIYVNSCRRAGMTFLFDPHSHPSLRANEPGGISEVERSASVSAILKNVAELRALFNAKNECIMNPGSENLVESVSSDETRIVRLTFFEHVALFTGIVGDKVSQAGRERLWIWLLVNEPNCIQAANVLKQQASAATRRVDEARRALFACTGERGTGDDETLMLLHVLMSPGHGLILARRRLLRALVRRGLPSRLRGFLWCRFSGAGDAPVCFSSNMSNLTRLSILSPLASSSSSSSYSS